MALRDFLKISQNFLEQKISENHQEPPVGGPIKNKGWQKNRRLKYNYRVFDLKFYLGSYSFEVFWIRIIYIVT